jgi:hypothetical protein
VRAAQANRGSTVRFVSEPGVPWKHDVTGFGDHVADD